ncbi:helix-turn-helix transcriptional regulator [bacterium]|nr:helix-turn-helix transcriptional regulator [bacterium]
MTQRQTAKSAGCSQPYICQVERGQKALSVRFSAILEERLELEPGTLSGLRVPRGRPALCDVTRWSRRQLYDTETLPPSPRVRLSLHPPAVGPPVHRDPFGALGEIFGEEAAREFRQLEESKGPDQLFWRRLNLTHFDSWPEKRFLVKLASTGLALQWLSPSKIGCELRVTDPVTGKSSGHRRRTALISLRGDTVIAAFPQLSVWTGVQYRRPDLTVVVSRGQSRATGALEVDGDFFHQDRAKEEQRDRELGIPVYHLNAKDVGDPAALELFYQWCEGLVA